MPGYWDSLHMYHCKVTLVISRNWRRKLPFTTFPIFRSYSSRQLNCNFPKWTFIFAVGSSLSISAVMQHHTHTGWSKTRNIIFCTHRVLFTWRHIRHECCSKWVKHKGVAAVKLSEVLNATCLQKLQCLLALCDAQLKQEREKPVI